jgi:hypothetical protein
MMTKKKRTKLSSTPKPVTPKLILSHFQSTTSRKPKAVPSSSRYVHETTFHSSVTSASISLRSSNSVTKPQFRRHSSVDQDIFRKAYERTLSVARNRLLFCDPYSLQRARATNGLLYSYYNHTPTCIFSRGVACNHHQDKTYKQEQTLSQIEDEKWFSNDIILEHYSR